MLFASGGVAADLTPSVETGLGVFYVIAAFANFVYAFVNTRNGAGKGGLIWNLVSVFFLILAVPYFLRMHLAMPLWLKDTSDMGLGYALLGTGVEPGTVATINVILVGLLYALLAAALLDAI